MDNADNDAKRDDGSSHAEFDSLLESLRASETRYRELFENANDLLFTVDLQGRFTSLNQTAEETTGFSRSELIGSDISVLVPPEFVETVRESMRHKIKTHERTRYEIEILAKDGRRIPVEIGSRLTCVNDQPEIQGIARDISERKRAERELQRAKEAAEESNRAKSAFLANMSHEIRTPLGGIIGMTELLLETELTPEQREYQGMVLDSAEALLNVLNDILDLSKIEAGKLGLEFTDFQLRETVYDALKTVAVEAAEKGVELACRIAANVPDHLVGDPGRLRQVMVNLAGNGIKFTHQGEVVVTVGVDSRSDDTVRLHVSVRDTGIGIPSDKQDDVFESFSQADATTTRYFGGTGLGLTISKNLVQMMGGFIWVESEEGSGSNFQFIAEFGVGRFREVPVPSELHGVAVLVVEDNDTNREILRDLMMGWHMEPTLVKGGDQALAALHQAVSRQQPFPVVVTDSGMPGMNGFELTEKIRADSQLASTHVLMLCSAVSARELSRSRKLGIKHCLTKPVKPSSLLSAIEQSLGIGHWYNGARSADLNEAGKPATRSLHLLLAEDGFVNQQVAMHQLSRLGHEVTLVESGREVIEILQQESFDAILMDLQMPEMDGIEATAEIRRREESTGAHLPIIALTAHAMKGDKERCLEAGMDGYLTKPIRVDQLTEVLEKLIPSTT